MALVIVGPMTFCDACLCFSRLRAGGAMHHRRAVHGYGHMLYFYISQLTPMPNLIKLVLYWFGSRPDGRSSVAQAPIIPRASGCRLPYTLAPSFGHALDHIFATPAEPLHKRGLWIGPQDLYHLDLPHCWLGSFGKSPTPTLNNSE